MADDHRAAWLAEASNLKRYQRQRATVLATTAASDEWRREQLDELDCWIEVTRELADWHLDLWNAAHAQPARG